MSQNSEEEENQLRLRRIREFIKYLMYNISYGVFKIEFKVFQQTQLMDEYLIFRSLNQDNIWLPQMFHHKVSLIKS